MVAIPAAVAIGLSAASAAAGVAGTVMSAQAQSQQAKQAAATANYNAQITQRNAYAERLQQQSQDEQQFAENNQRLGQIRALYGASGIDASGSVLDVLQGNANQMAYQTRQGDYAEQLRQMGYTSEAQNYEQQAAADRQQASNATGLGMGLGIASSLFGAASSFAGSDTGKSFLQGDGLTGSSSPFASAGSTSLTKAG